jgi:catechol 2,3-dioxygenase-like lactoylglutathione lyase family enzyme
MDQMIPILPCGDLAGTVEFYGRLGFEFKIHNPDTEPYAVGWRGHTHVHFFQCDHVVPNYSGCYWSVLDADALHREFSAAIAGVSRIEDKPWGRREFHFIDPSGNLVRVGHLLN